jgi:hypothetical protein
MKSLGYRHLLPLIFKKALYPFFPREAQVRADPNHAFPLMHYFIPLLGSDASVNRRRTPIIAPISFVFKVGYFFPGPLDLKGHHNTCLGTTGVLELSAQWLWLPENKGNER